MFKVVCETFSGLVHVVPAYRYRQAVKLQDSRFRFRTVKTAWIDDGAGKGRLRTLRKDPPIVF